jgi:hypothetical protein
MPLFADMKKGESVSTGTWRLRCSLADLMIGTGLAACLLGILKGGITGKFTPLAVDYLLPLCFILNLLNKKINAILALELTAFYMWGTVMWYIPWKYLPFGSPGPYFPRWIFDLHPWLFILNRAIFAAFYAVILLWTARRSRAAQSTSAEHPSRPRNGRGSQARIIGSRFFVCLIVMIACFLTSNLLPPRHIPPLRSDGIYVQIRIVASINLALLVWALQRNHESRARNSPGDVVKQSVWLFVLTAIWGLALIVPFIQIPGYKGAQLIL